MNALFVGCSDGRIAARLGMLQADLAEPNADRLIVPGGPLVFTRPGMERRVALDCLRTQLDVHDIRTIYLVSHQDCAAYGRALGGFGFDQQELLERDLQRVKSLLENTFPEVTVRCFIIPWRENGQGADFGEAEPVE
jgi:hypothetical protein